MKLAPSPPTPLELTLTRSVVPRRRSRTKTSSQPLVSPGTMLSVSDTNTTNRPSADIHPPPPSTGLPSDVRLTSSTPSPSAARAWGPPPVARPIARAPLITSSFLFSRYRRSLRLQQAARNNFWAGESFRRTLALTRRPAHHE